MRVTNSMMVNNMMRNLNHNLNRMDKLEQNLASGKKFTRPSDDPIGVSRSLRLNTEISIMEQHNRNADDAQSWLEVTEMAVANMSEVLKRAKDLTIQGANATYSDEDRSKIGVEIQELRNQLISISNTNYAGSYIFCGFKTDKPLMDKNGNYDLGGQTLKTDETININIGVGDAIGINFIGQKLFGRYTAPADLDSPVNIVNVSSGDASQLIQVFDQLVADLNAGNMQSISAAIPRIENYLDNTNAVRAEIGVKTNRVELTINRIKDDTVNLNSLLSKNEDADMAEVIMKLKMSENVYKSSLSGGARIIQSTLMDFLR